MDQNGKYVESVCSYKFDDYLNLNGIRRKEPMLAIIYNGGGVYAHVIKCLSRRSGG